MQERQGLWPLTAVCLLAVCCAVLVAVPSLVTAQPSVASGQQTTAPSRSVPVQDSMQKTARVGEKRLALRSPETAGERESGRPQSGPSAEPGSPGVAEQCQVLVVDDDWNYGSPNNGGLPYYTSALDTLGVSYDVWDTESPIGDAPTFWDMVGYDVVLWFTGYAHEMGVFTPVNEQQVRHYLDTGGQFILSSQDYYWEADDITPFMDDYLGVGWVDDTNVSTSLAGVTGHPIGDWLGPYTLVRPDDWDVYWPIPPYQGPYDDIVEARSGASSPFRYDDPDNTATNSTSLEGPALGAGLTEIEQEPGFRTVFLGWPFEWVDTVEQRSDILGAILGWMDCVPQMSLTPRHAEANGPPGAGVAYTLLLANDLGWTESFEITYDSPWETEGPAMVGPIPDASDLSFVVTVTVPADAGCYETSQASVTARAQTDPQYSASSLLETGAEPDGSGGLDGVVTDANTDLGIAGAQVRLELAEHMYETNTGQDGSYALSDLPACVYEGQYSAMGYSPTGAEIPIPRGITLTVDVELEAPVPILSHDAVAVSVPDGSTMTFGLVLTNAGSADLAFQITETTGGPEAPLSAWRAESRGAEKTEGLAESAERSVATEQEDHMVTGYGVLRRARGDERAATRGSVGPAAAGGVDVPWLSVQPENGLLEPGASQDIELAFDTAGLDWRVQYTASLLFEYNDPYVLRAFLPVTLTVECVEASSLALAGPEEVPAGEIGLYSLSWEPVTATEPVDILWSNGATGTSAEYSWDEPGAYTVVVSASVCTRPEPLVSSLGVLVTEPNRMIYLPVILRSG